MSNDLMILAVFALPLAIAQFNISFEIRVPKLTLKNVQIIAVALSALTFFGIIALAIAGGEFGLISIETFTEVAKPMGVVCFFSTFVSYIIAESK